MTYTYIDENKRGKVCNLLLKAREKHEELLRRQDLPKDRKEEISDIIQKIDRVLNHYFKPNIWLIKPGEGAEIWDECVKEGKICVGWVKVTKQLGEKIFEYDNYDDFSRDFKKIGKDEEGYKDPSQLWMFLKEVSKRDILLAMRGSKEIIGIGIIESNPYLDAKTESDYPICRKVKWIHTNLSLRSPKTHIATIIMKLEWRELDKNPELKRVLENVLKSSIETPRGETLSPEIDPKTKKIIDDLLESKKQVILYGPPGTGKTWIARNYVKVKTNDDRKFYEFVTFHPSYSYEEFIEGIKPIPAENGLRFIVEDGIFKRIVIRAICEALRSAEGELASVAGEVLELLSGIERGLIDSYGNYVDVKRQLLKMVSNIDRSELKRLFENAPKFYLVIDEINRGDISRIFGELITLLEADKRLFAENEITVTLPYSKTKFGVPPNLFIIGTMNTADRSIALIDIALRRRFGFIELMPFYKVLINELGIDNVENEDEAIQKIKNWNENDLDDVKKLAVRVLYTINERIRKLYDRDHQIGHSYLLKLKDCEDEIETLKYIWFCEIIPLLQEYFYDSPEKLRKVLNSEFITVEDESYEFKRMEEFDDNGFINALKRLIRG